MGTKKISINSIVSKSNELIPMMSRYTLQELRLIAYCVAHFDSRNSDNPLCVAKVSELANLFDIPETSAYSYIKNLVKSLNPVEFTENDEKVNVLWFKAFKYNDRKGEITFMINDLMEDFLLELKENFSCYRLSDVHKFKSAGTWHIFENLNKWRNAGAWHVTIKELRRLLDVEYKYQRFDSFRQYLIDPAIAEINNKSSLNVEYIKEKSGKFVIALRFFIDIKQHDYVITIESQKNKLFKLLINCGIRNHAAEKIIDQIVGAGREEDFIKKLPEMQKRWCHEKGSMPRYVAGAVKRELSSKPSSMKKSKSDNFSNIGKKCEVAVQKIVNDNSNTNKIETIQLNRIPFKFDEEYGKWLETKGITFKEDLKQWKEEGTRSFICKSSYQDFLYEREQKLKIKADTK